MSNTVILAQTRVWSFPTKAKADNFTKFIIRNGFRMVDLLTDPDPSNNRVFVTMVSLWSADFNAASRLAHNDGGTLVTLPEGMPSPMEEGAYFAALSNLRP